MSKMKAKAMEQEEAQLPAKAASVAPATAGSNAYLDVAREELGDSIGQMLKFTKASGVSATSRSRSTPSSSATCRRRCAAGVKFEGGKCTERQIGKISDRFPVPDREELGDLDQANWEKDASGKPRDRWSKQYYLPLVSVDAQRVPDVRHRLARWAARGGGPVRLVRPGSQRRQAADRRPRHPYLQASDLRRYREPEFSISGWDEAGYRRWHQLSRTRWKTKSRFGRALAGLRKCTSALRSNGQ